MHITRMTLSYDAHGLAHLDGTWSGITGSVCLEQKAQLLDYGAIFVGADWERVTAATIPANVKWALHEDQTIPGATTDPDVLADWKRAIQYIQRGWKGEIPDGTA